MWQIDIFKVLSSDRDKLPTFDIGLVLWLFAITVEGGPRK